MKQGGCVNVKQAGGSRANVKQAVCSAVKMKQTCRRRER